jgi:hypothetical protein
MRRSIPRQRHEEILTAERIRHQQALDQVKARLADMEARLSAVSADRERLRTERDQFAKDRDAFKIAAETAGRQATQFVEATDEEVAVWEARAAAHWAWRPPVDRDQWPPDGASGRPTHPATDLKRALERCRAVQALRDADRKQVAP